MQNKASLILKKLTFYRRFSTTLGLAIVWLDGVTSASVLCGARFYLLNYYFAFVFNFIS